MSALIPGINNIASIGSRPTCRIGKVIAGSLLTPIVSSKGMLAGVSRAGSSRGSAMSNSPLSRSSIYNPISNPVPQFTQNPYIMRQRGVMLRQQASSGALNTSGVAHSEAGEVLH